MIKIFIDMDGVLVDYVRGLAHAFEEDHDLLIERWPHGEYDASKVLNMSKEAFYERLDTLGEDFWINLPPYSFAIEFYNYCTKLAPTLILTAPAYNPFSLSGKVRWLRKYFGNIDFIITKRKEMCARNNHILIDDLESNVIKFREEGGQAILWPNHFNIRHSETHKALELVKTELELCQTVINGISQSQGRQS